MTLPRRTLLATCPALLAAPARADEVTAFCGEYERKTGGRVGLYARNVATGHTLSWRAKQRFVMCSTFKMSLVACVLARVDQGSEQLSRLVQYRAAALLSYAPVARQNLATGGMTVETMCQATVELSDNTCANLLLDTIGGPHMLTRFWRMTGDGISRLDHKEPVLNNSPPGDPQDTTTPAAMSGNLHRFLLGDVLSPESRARLTGWMLHCQTGAALLRAGLPSDWRLADKTGNNGRDALCDIGVAWPASQQPVLICAYTQGGKPQPEQLPTVLAGIGRLVSRQLA